MPGRAGPGDEWGVNLHGTEMMKAVHFYAPAIDGNTLPGSHMAVNLLQPGAKAVLNHLHSAANAQNGQVPPLGHIKKRSLGFVAIRSMAAIGRQVIPPGKDDAADFLANRQCGVHGIGDGNWYQPAPEEEFYPDLIEAIATRAVWRVD